MASMDLFRDSAFELTQLTLAINTPVEGQRIPTAVDALFAEEGITTTSMMIEREGQSLAMVGARERGAPGQVVLSEKRNLLAASVVHLPQRASVKADEVQGVRAFGSETELQTVMNIVSRRLQKMMAQLEATIRYHRIGAVKGQVMDSDGVTVLHDMFAIFGFTRQTQAMALTTATTNVRNKIITAKRMSEDVIADSGIISGYTALCGRNFFDALIDHATVKEAYQFYNAQLKSLDPRSAGFPYAEVVWREYYGRVNGVDFIDADEAYLIPNGIPDLFITRYAPADYMETVNTVGLPYYAKQESMPFNKGVEIEAQSNPINLCTRPRSIIKLTKV